MPCPRFIFCRHNFTCVINKLPPPGWPGWRAHWHKHSKNVSLIFLNIYEGRGVDDSINIPMCNLPLRLDIEKERKRRRDCPPPLGGPLEGRCERTKTFSGGNTGA